MIHMTLEERVEALEKELQKMKDIEAIKELKRKVFPLPGRKDVG